MNVITRIFESVRFKIAEYRVSNHAEQNAFSKNTIAASHVVAAVHGNPITDPSHLLEPVSVADTAKEQATVAEVGEQLAHLPWARFAPLPILLFLWIGWRGSSRIFLLSGFPSTDAMLLGAMLECFNVFLVWLLHEAWLRPYDGTNRRKVHLAFLTIIYLALIGCMVALRLGQADPNESFILRLANAGLLVLSVTGPAFAIEMLGRLAYRVAPLLYRRNRAMAVIRRAEGAQQREITHRKELAAQYARYADQAGKLERLYELEYTKAEIRFAKGRE